MPTFSRKIKWNISIHRKGLSWVIIWEDGEEMKKMLFFYMEIHFSSNCLAISTLLSQDDNKKSHTLSSIPGKSFPPPFSNEKIMNSVGELSSGVVTANRLSRIEVVLNLNLLYLHEGITKNNCRVLENSWKLKLFCEINAFGGKRRMFSGFLQDFMKLKLRYTIKLWFFTSPA